MKMYTNSEQTAKLIELGFDRPKNRVIKQLLDRSTGSWITVGEEDDYSIGELIELLPTDIVVEDTCVSRVTEQNGVMYYSFLLDFVAYECQDSIELIDNLYDMIVKLKEEEII